MEKIKLPVRNKIFLAPMEGVNDVAFRIMCKEAGVGMTYTQLTAVMNPNEIHLDDKPVMQIFANKLLGIKDFIKKHDSKVSYWDLNLGCPSTMAKKQGHGSYLEDLDLIEDILKLMRKTTKKAVTVKIRKSPIADEVLKIAQIYCDAIGIHARTREKAYTGDADLDWAKEFKKKSKIPVIYSGNVDETNYKEYLEIFDYVMIGRKAIGHPEIFSKITNTKFNKSFKRYLELAQKYNIPWRLIKFQAMQFTKGDRYSKKKRLEIYKTKNLEELKKIYF